MDGNDNECVGGDPTMSDGPGIQRTVQELESTLEEERQLTAARNRLLETHISELNDIYRVLKEKLRDLRTKDEKLRDFEAALAQANKLAALGELAGSIAHEIKNPLISIQGFAERIEKTEEREKITKYARFISKEAKRLSEVLVNLLDFSRMHASVKESIDLNEVVADTLLFMEHHLTRFKKVMLDVRKADSLPSVRIDKVQIQQVIVNVVMNAAQAMPGGGTISIVTEKAGDAVVLSVSDQGTGIAEENLKRIFEPYFTTKRKGEGTGLGLSLCKKLTEANGGTIEVASLPGKGTTVRLILPL